MPDTSIGIELNLTVSRQPNRLDHADVLPASVRSVTAGERFYVHMWASMGAGQVDSLSCAAANLQFDQPGLRALSVTNASGFNALQLVSIARRAVKNAGGCISPDGLDVQTGMTWARIATIEMIANNPGEGTLQLTQPDSAFLGNAVLGIDEIIDPSQVMFEGLKLRVREPQTGFNRSLRSKTATR